MTDQEPQNDALTPGPSPGGRGGNRADWLLLGVLLALVLPLRVWLLCNTEVTARDSIGYIRYALQFERDPWRDVLKSNQQHPGYPITVWLMSVPVRAIDGAATPENMELSAQLVSFLASLLLILPSHFLGRQFFNRSISFGGTLLYQFLPISAQLLSDGISEPLYLLLLVSGLLCAVRAIQNRNPWCCTLVGVFGGLAYLTRPEGALLLPSFGVVLIALQCRAAWRCSWGQFFACGSALTVSAVLVGATYAITIGGLTNKPSALDVLHQPNPAEKKAAVETVPSVHLGGGMHLFAATFVPHVQKIFRLAQSGRALVAEINQGFHYVAGVPALLGIWWSFGSLRRQVGFWVMIAYALLHGLVLVALAMSVSYVSDRHVMILVLLGCFFVAAGLGELPRRILGWFKTRTGDTAVASTTTWHRSASLWFAVLFIALIGVCLPKATQRLHGNRAGNHQAGIWLAEHVHEGDVVADDHSWSLFFSGMVFSEWRKPAYPANLTATCYVVSTRVRDPQLDPKRLPALLAEDARVVYVWPEQSELAQARVVVYAQPRTQKYHPWRVCKE